MTLDKVREVVRKYQKEGSGPLHAIKADDDFVIQRFPSPDVVYGHVSYMCVEILKMCDSAEQRQLVCVDGMEHHDNDSDVYHQHSPRCYQVLHDADVREKTMRWLGFVQAVLWCTGLKTLRDLKAENGSEVH